jgi:catechol 2,3-dioxygenase-like lactoylglutathione lyase family enzyme
VTTRQDHLGRLIDHVHLVVRDIEASRGFYRAVLGSLGRELSYDADEAFACDELFVSSVREAGSHSAAPHRVHLAFQASDREAVARFFAAALAAGGRDNGAPGERSYHPAYYAAFVLDPDGNNIEAVHHGRGTRSAPSVVVTIGEAH